MPNRIGHGSNVRYLTRSKSLWITVHPEVYLIEIHNRTNIVLDHISKGKLSIRLADSLTSFNT